ncbi:unnamed protein product [Prorocentrum cordatum]|uniref:RING-type domain-containing protein n=1 Tax=Prorocentrum cordatum TaxID=2364126 RepID=A0ABN9W4S2_9DINO|nr:unnamed protein product [Polarella glacialis]
MWSFGPRSSACCGCCCCCCCCSCSLGGDSWAPLPLHDVLAARGRRGPPEPVDVAFGLLKSTGEDGYVCVICMEDLSLGCEVGRLECNHVFHAGCIRAWVQQAARRAAACPLRCFAPAAGGRRQEALKNNSQANWQAAAAQCRKQNWRRPSSVLGSRPSTHALQALRARPPSDLWRSPPPPPLRAHASGPRADRRLAAVTVGRLRGPGSGPPGRRGTRESSVGQCWNSASSARAARDDRIAHCASLFRAHVGRPDMPEFGPPRARARCRLCKPCPPGLCRPDPVGLPARGPPPSDPGI